MSQVSAAVRDQLAVAVQSPAHDLVAISTQFMIERWDDEQTQWALGKAREEWAGSLRPGWEPTKKTFVTLGVKPYLVTVHDNCNNVLQAGWVALLGGIAGTTITNKFSATNGRIGAGTSSTAVAYTQTALQGDTGGASTTSYYKLVSGAPTVSTGSSPPTLVFVASFGSGVANFAWQEFGTDNYTADGVTTTGLGVNFIFFNRGLSNQGTKTVGQTWTATETISFGFPSGAGTVS